MSDYTIVLIASTMNYSIKNEPLLRKILWLDCMLGGITAIIGLLCSVTLTTMLGVTTSFVLTIATINLMYAVLAFIVAAQKTTSVRLLNLLIYANWAWTAISVFMIFTHFNSATDLGNILLLIQPIVVGGLAYSEGNQIVAIKAV